MDIKEHVKVFLSFSKKERRGIYLLLAIAMLLWILPVFFAEDGSPEELLEITPLQINRAKKILLEQKEFPRFKSNYRPYAQRSETWGRRQPIARDANTGDFKGNADHRPKPAVIDLNEADSVALEQLPGIGERLSSRIIKYRDRLGGFHGVEQLKEVYGLRDSALQLLFTRVTVKDKFPLKKIAVNQASYAMFRKHPYMSHAFAKSLVAYREMHGPIRGAEDLYKLVVVTKEEIDKMVPYFSFEE